MSKFLFSFEVIAFGLCLGYLIQILVKRGALSLPVGIDRLRRFLIKSALLFVMPVTVVGAIWSIKVSDPKLITLPILGAFALLSGGALALAASKLLDLNRRETGSLFTCGFCTNLGSIGSLVCFLFLGEMGFALVAIYRLFEDLLYYTVGFSVARFYSSERVERETGIGRIKKLFADPFILVSMASITLGGLLHGSGFQRPEFYGAVNALFVPFGTILLLISIGLGMKVHRVRDYLAPCFAISLVKFFMVPLAVTLTAWLLGYGNTEEGLFLKVVMILSSMPVAFNAFVPSTLYDLDIDMVSSCWLFTTGMLVIILPALYALIHWV